MSDANREKILIIDDEADLRSAVKKALEDADFSVIEAVNGEEGLAKARTEDPDLILLDISMPKMNGHQVLKELRAHPTKKNPHILLFTNSEDPGNIVRGVTLKSDDYIIKAQMSLSDVVKKVKQHLAGYYDRN